MKEIITVVKGNLRKSKGVYIGIGVLLMVVTLSLVTIFSVLTNTNTHDKEAIEEAGFGQIFSAVNFIEGEGKEKYKELCNKLVSDIEGCDYVEKVDLIETEFVNIQNIKGKSSGNSSFVISATSKYLQYVICDENGKVIDDLVVNEGEIIVPISFQSLYSAKIGDKVTLKYDETEYNYEIVAYFEDPFMGSSLMGIKTLLINENDINQMAANSEEYGMGYALNIFKKDNCNLNDVEFEAKLNKDTEFSGYSWISLSRSQAYSYMTMLTNIFAGILIAFIVMLIFATLIVLNHNISNNIEHDYTNIGVLKALGMSNVKIKYTIMLGYLAACLCGVILGIALSTQVIKVINSLMRPVTGLLTEDTPAVFVSIAVLVALIVVIVLFINIKLRGVRKITPVSAINGGRKSIHFSSIFKLPIIKKMLSISIAYRQIISSKKQYAGAVIITSILVMFMIMISDACIWFTDGENSFAKMYSPAEYDLNVGYVSDEVMKQNEEKLEKIISKYTKMEKYILGSQYMLINDTQIWCGICDNPDKLKNVYEGRTCKYDNEMLITEYVRDNYGFDIGDSVTVNYEGKEEEFVVSGIYQCSNDAGKNVCISLDGYAKLNPDYTINSYVYDLEKGDTTKDIINEIESTFNTDEVIAKDANVFEGYEVITTSVIGVAVVIYILAGIFSIITVEMVCNKLFAKEKTEYGVYKAIGMTAKLLRRTFATRFVIASLIGSALGIILTILFSDMIVGAIFKTFGVYNYSSNTRLTAIIIPVVFMAVVYYVISYIVSKKIKKVTPRVLISE